MLAVDKNASDEDVLSLWDCKLFDTVAIASVFGITEHDLERRLWAAREARRNQGQGVRNGTNAG